MKSTNEIYEIFVQAVHYGIYPLIYTLIDKLSENRLTDRNLKFILTSVISSGNLTLIKAIITEMIEKHGDRLSYLEDKVVIDIFNKDIDRLYDMNPESTNEASQETINEVIYLLLIISGSGLYDLLKILVENDKTQEVIDYVLIKILKDNPKDFDFILSALFEYLVGSKNYDKFVRYFDEYSKNIEDLDNMKFFIGDIDHYPYNFTKAIGAEITADKVYVDLEEAIENKMYELFMEIWHDYSYLLSEIQSRFLKHELLQSMEDSGKDFSEYMKELD